LLIENMNTIIWIGIVLCLSQSAMFSGMNLGLFSISKLELKVEAKKGNRNAEKILKLRDNANLTLVTILWGNVGVNVLLALLSNSVLTGVIAFLFSTVVITVFAEIIPQAYFTRHALRLAASLMPLFRVYLVLLYPVSRPSAWVLDTLLGGEEIRYFKEQDLRKLIRLHMEAASSDIDQVEGQGALNFLELDDVPMSDEGEMVDPQSIVQLEFKDDKPLFPPIKPDADNELLQHINRSGQKWIVIVDSSREPRLLLQADDFIRAAIFEPENFKPYRYCHRPLVVRDEKARLGDLIKRFSMRRDRVDADIVENDVILLWGEEPRIVTGDDILGRLLRGIAIPAKSSN